MGLKISGPQQGWPRPLPGAILIPPVLLVVADCLSTLFVWCGSKSGPISHWMKFMNAYVLYDQLDINKLDILCVE